MGDSLVLEDRYFRIHDAASGKVLYTSPRMPTLVHGFPITYAVNGKQYVEPAVEKLLDFQLTRRIIGP